MASKNSAPLREKKGMLGSMPQGQAPRLERAAQGIPRNAIGNSLFGRGRTSPFARRPVTPPMMSQPTMGPKGPYDTFIQPEMNRRPFMPPPTEPYQKESSTPMGPPPQYNPQQTNNLIQGFASGFNSNFNSQPPGMNGEDQAQQGKNQFQTLTEYLAQRPQMQARAPMPPGQQPQMQQQYPMMPDQQFAPTDEIPQQMIPVGFNDRVRREPSLSQPMMNRYRR